MSVKSNVYSYPGDSACKDCMTGYPGLHHDTCPEYRGERITLQPMEHCAVCLRLSPIGTDCSHTGNLHLLTATSGMDLEVGAHAPNQPQEPGLPSESPSHTEAA